MACELPVVASAVGGITDSVVPEETGFLCQPKDVECFSKRLRQLGDDPELRTQMGQRGRGRVIENYSAEELADAFDDALTATENQ
jgi:glycosyltransferase involved in cell wall biosynthesis